MRIARPGEPHYTAVTVPLLADGQVLLLNRQRGPLGNVSLELPRGEWSHDERGWQKSAAARLLRETGLSAARLKLLGAIMIDPALLSLETIVLLAEECTAGLGDPSDGANLPDGVNLPAGSISLALESLDHLIRRGEITCGVTLSALSLYRAWQSGPAAAS